MAKKYHVKRGFVDFDAEGLDEFRDLFGDLVDRQLPFALSVALNNMAWSVARFLVGDLDHYFTVRSTWTGKGIRGPGRKGGFHRATKKEPWAEVGTLDEYMRRQAEGGIKRNKGGRSKFVAVPRRARSPKTQKTSISRWPSTLAKKKLFFLQDTKKGRAGLWRKTGRKGTPRLWWIFLRQVKIKPVWPFEETTEKIVRLRWQVEAKKALFYAIETSMRLTKAAKVGDI